MKKYLIILIGCLLVAGCSSLNMERVAVGDPDSIVGTYNMIMVGGTFKADAERLVILDLENDKDSFRPVTIPGRIKMVPALTASQALQKAEIFFKGHCAYNGFDIKKLNTPAGEFVGYELIPDYPASICEDGNIVEVSYGQGDEGEIKVYTWLLLKRDPGESKRDTAIVPGK